MGPAAACCRGSTGRVPAGARAGTGEAGVRRRHRTGSHRCAGDRHRCRAGSAGVVDPPRRGSAHGSVRAARNPGRAPSLRVRAPRGESATPRRVPVGRGPAGEGGRRGAGTVRLCELRECTVARRARRRGPVVRAGEHPQLDPVQGRAGSGDRLGYCRHAGAASAAAGRRDRHCLLRRIDHGSPGRRNVS